MAKETTYIDLGYDNLLQRGGNNLLTSVEVTALADVSDSSSLIVSSGGSYNGDTDSVEDYVSTEQLLSGDMGSQWRLSEDGYFVGGADGYFDGTGFFMGWDRDNEAYSFFIGDSAGDYITWDGSTLTLSGTFAITGGSIAGMTITADSLTAVSGGNTTIVSSGATAFIAGPTGSPTFTVTQAGVLTSTSGTIGGWTIGATTLANGTNIILDSSNKAISINDATFGNSGIQMQYNGGTPRMHVGTTTKYLQFDGTNVNFTQGVIDGTSTANGSTVANIQTRAEDEYSEYDFVYKGRFEDSDAALTTPFMVISGNGSVARNALTTKIDSGGATSNKELMKSVLMGSQFSGGSTVAFDWGIVDLVFSFTFDIDQSTNQDVFMGLYDLSTLPPNGANATDTVRHIGIYIADATVYFSNANGTTQTTTDVTADFTFGAQQFVEIVWDSGTSATLYLNGSTTASATHTTNLPASSAGKEPVIIFNIETQENLSKLITLKNNYIVAANIV